MEPQTELTSVKSFNVPKLSLNKFVIKNNYYVVVDAGMFHYFPIKVKVDNPQSPLIRFEKSPSVIIEGMAIVDKNVYLVNVPDLLRGIIRKSKKTHIESKEDGNAIVTTDLTEAVSIDPTTISIIQSEDESRSISAINLEINQAANATWDQQINALLDYSSEEEGEDW